MNTKIFISIIFLLNILSCYNGINDSYNTTSDTVPAGYSVSYKLPDSVSFSMKYVPGGTFPTGVNDSGDTDGDNINDVSSPSTISTPFWIAETETTYQLWKAVYDWALTHGYTISHAGVMGDGTGDTNQHPVTTINWRDMMVWCNALTEYYNANNSSDKDLDCVYYTDAAFTVPIRAADDTASLSAAPGAEDNPYVKSTASGFRLPGSMEWECAARYKNGITWTPGSYASGATAAYTDVTATELVSWDSANAGSSTHAVKSKSANSLGIYDMSGNVWEWCFDGKPSYPYGTRVERGGNISYTKNALQVGFVDYLGTWNEGTYIGFRIARTQ